MVTEIERGMMIKEKVILVDCDGVLLDWEYAFDQWMKRHGYTVVVQNEYKMHIKYGIEKAESKRLVRMFNESAWIRKLPPLRDAIKYVKKLHQEHGYIFHAITSLSNDQYAQHLRTKNLRELFGDTVFEEYVYLDTGADKDNALLPYAETDCYWVEDKPENAQLGADLGLDALLMNHHHNQEYTGDARRVNNWKEIYDIIVG
jgi:FMN phosphatase YigB (HAD superfamily)